MSATTLHRHPIRRSILGRSARRRQREDLAFFLVSFAAAFVILYGFVV